MTEFRRAVGLILFAASLIALIMSAVGAAHLWGPKILLLYIPLVTALLGLLMAEDA